MSDGITWTPVSCTVANVIAGAPEIVISSGRTDTEGAFREYETADGTPVLREWWRAAPADARCRHEVPNPEDEASR
jgi:hypothetical protein